MGKVRKRKQKKKKYNTGISYEVIPQKHQTLLVPVTILHPHMNTQRGEGKGRGWRRAGGGAAVGHMWSEREREDGYGATAQRAAARVLIRRPSG